MILFIKSRQREKNSARNVFLELSLERLENFENYEQTRNYEKKFAERIPILSK